MQMGEVIHKRSRYQTLDTVFFILWLVDVSDMRFGAQGLTFHAHGQID